MAGAQTAGGTNATFAFEATPPRRSSDPMRGRQDTHPVEVRIRNAGDRAEIWVDGARCVTTRRAALRSWLMHSDARPDYIEAALTLTHRDRSVWLEIEDKIAPTILTRPAINRIVLALTADQSS